MCEEGAMRALILALTAVTILALTAFTAGAVLVGSTELGAPTDQHVRSGGLGVIGQSGFLRSGAYDRLARGDMTGTGGGDKMGGMMGDMMGGMGMGR
jgi:hypothetical protein